MLRTNRQTDKQTVSKILPTPIVGVGNDRKSLLNPCKVNGGGGGVKSPPGDLSTVVSVPVAKIHECLCDFA